MDAERAEQFLHGDGVEALDGWQLNVPFSCFQNTLQNWVVDPNCVSLLASNSCIMGNTG